MPRDNNGNYTLTSGNPVIPGTEITASWANPTLEDLAAAISDSLSRTGQGGMLYPLAFGDGVQAAPGIAWTQEVGTGFFRAGTSDMQLAVSGYGLAMRWYQGRSYVRNAANTAWSAIQYQGGPGSVPDGDVSNNILKWNVGTTAWIAAPSNTLPGTVPDGTVTNQVPKWSGTAWVPGTTAGLPGTVASGTVDEQTLVWDHPTLTWVPTDKNPGGYLPEGDVTANSLQWDVPSNSWLAVIPQAPSGTVPDGSLVNNILSWGGTGWTAAPSTSLAGTVPNGTVVNHVPKWNGTTWSPGTSLGLPGTVPNGTALLTGLQWNNGTSAWEAVASAASSINVGTVQGQSTYWDTTLAKWNPTSQLLFDSTNSTYGMGMSVGPSGTTLSVLSRLFVGRSDATSGLNTVTSGNNITQSVASRAATSTATGIYSLLGTALTFTAATGNLNLVATLGDVAITSPAGSILLQPTGAGENITLYQPGAGSRIAFRSTATLTTLNFAASTQPSAEVSTGSFSLYNPSGSLLFNTYSTGAAFYGSTLGDVLISTDRVNNRVLMELPTSSAGLPSGALWRNGNVVNIV